MDRRLFNTLPTLELTELFDVVEQELHEALTGKSDQFFYNIDIYLSKAPKSLQYFSDSAKTMIRNYASKYAWHNPAKAETWLAYFSKYYLAIFSALEHFVFVGVDMEKPGYPTALYTRSRLRLAQLESNGQLTEPLNDKVLNALCGTKTEKSLYDGSFVVARLDVVKVKDGVPIFKVVIPRSNLFIGAGLQYVFIPVPFYYMFEKQLVSNFANKPIRYTKSTVKGAVTSTVSVHPDVVRKVYVGNEDKLVDTKIRKITPGYDVTNQRFFAYDVEASLNSLGVASFRPEMLDSLRSLDYADVDKSRHNINFDILRGVYKTRIKGAKGEQLDTLSFIDLSSYATVKDKAEAVLAYGDVISDTEMYHLMKSNTEVFGDDLEEAMEKRERLLPKFLKTMESVDLPESESERVDALNDMLRAGIVKITSTTKEGAVFEKVGSNNQQVLERMLSKDYVKNFESIRTKLYYVRDLLKSGKLKTKLRLERVLVEFNLSEYVNTEEFFSKSESTRIKAVDDAIEELKQKASTRNISESTLLYRNVYASEPKDFFGRIDVNNILAVEFASA